MSDEDSDEEGEREALNLTSFLFGNIRRCGAVYSTSGALAVLEML